MDDDAGRAGLVVFGLAAAAAVVVSAACWIARHPDQVHQAVTRQLERPWITGLNRRYRTQLTWLTDRFRPGRALGLALTVQLVILAAAGSAFGILVEEVISGGGAARIDLPIVRYLAEHRAAWLTTLMGTLTWLGGTTVLIPLVIVVGLLARRRTRSWATLALLGLSFGGAIVLYDVIKLVVGRPRPHVAPLVATASGYSFPSGHSTQVVVVSATLALLASAATNSWPRKVMAWSIAVLVSLIVGFSRVYLGVHWPIDVMAGFGLGATWAALCFATIRFSRRPRVTAAPAGSHRFTGGPRGKG